MKFRCNNCGWIGEELVKEKFCAVCGDHRVEEYIPIDVPKKVENPLDLNNDGVFDKKDKSIAAKVLASGKRKKWKK